MRKTLTATLAALLIAILGVAGAGIAFADDEVGPDTAACAEAGTAVAAATKLLTAKVAADKAAAAVDAAGTAAVTAQTASDKAGAANGVAPLADRAAAAARVQAIDTYLAGDPAITEAQKALFKTERDAAASLVTALDAKATAAKTKTDADAAFAAAGGADALGKLALAGGISVLISHQRDVCGTTSTVSPTPQVPTPSGTFSQVGKVPAGGVETGA